MIWVDDVTKWKYDFFKALKALLSYSRTLVFLPKAIALEK